jgi:putative sigma-54 modulation protein
MHIEFVGRHVALDDEVRSHAEEKLARLSKLFGEPAEVHVTLESEKHRQIAELRVRLRRGELLAREEAPDLIGAINLAVEKLDGQARRTRERRVNSKRRSARVAVRKVVAATVATAGGAES